jgi:hypothetical protein
MPGEGTLLVKRVIRSSQTAVYLGPSLDVKAECLGVIECRD